MTAPANKMLRAALAAALVAFVVDRWPRAGGALLVVIIASMLVTNAPRVRALASSLA